MHSGADVDILSGLPRKEADKARDKETQEHGSRKLADKAAFLGISGSADGQRLIKIVSDLLETRIEELVSKDEAASALVSVLRELGHMESGARRAVQTLYERHLKARTHKTGPSPADDPKG